MPDVRPEEIWFDSHGTRLFAVERGRGRPLILLHGGMADHLACLHLAGSLASSLRLITPDVRGAGRSIDHGPLTWTQLADDVAQLARHLDLRRVAVGGWSFGAGLAARVALQHPDLVDSLILVHPAFAGADRGLTPAQQTAMVAMDAAARRALTHGTDALLPLFDPLPEDVRARARAMVATFDPASVAATTHFLASGEQPFASAADLAAVDVPTLVVPGTDPYHPAEVAAEYARHLPRCTFRATSDIAGAIAELFDRAG